MEKNGVGGTIETDYNAAGKATEMRTIGPDGKLQQKVDYQYLPGYYGAQQTDTTYWANGKVRKTVRHTYDPSTNFTGEFIQTFDKSGKQVDGHKLTHDPRTGIYRCSEWKVAAHSYRTAACPSGEEESGGAKQVLQTFTYDEVTKNLEAARKAVRQETRPATLGQTTDANKQREVALVLPAPLRTGERVSGTIVENPEEYEEMPGVTVTRLKLPVANSQPAGYQFEINGEKLQSVNGAFTFVVPSQSFTLSTVPAAGDIGQTIAKIVTLRGTSSQKLPTHQSFEAVPLCLKGQLCVVEGPFSGDVNRTFACFDNHPTTIVAESSRAAFLLIPDSIASGPRTLFLAEGAKLAALPMIIGQLAIQGNGRELKAGDTLIGSATLSGPADLPETAWEGDSFPATSLEMARRLIPGFPLHRNNRGAGNEKADQDEEKHEHGEKREGEVVLILKNAVPQSLSLRASTNHMLIFHLGDESFERGDFTYNLLVEAKQPTKVSVRGYVIPFLAPVTAQEFEAK